MRRDDKKGHQRGGQSDRLEVTDKPPEAEGLNVEGREPTRPVDGFGQLWRKTYQVRLTGKNVSPEAVVATWKEHLPDFMPANSNFYPTVYGIKAGEIVYIDAKMPGGLSVSTGVLVIDSDDTRFTLATPQGHPESGYNSFSAHREGGVTVAQIQSVARAADPLYEFGYRFLGGMRHQEKIWRAVLTALARHYGIRRPRIEMRRGCLDRRVQLSKAGHIWYNALIRTTLHTPVRVMRRLTGGQ